ncbi:hypothetical protein QFC19_005495 [Naganishia cerealis]|uniref:Uncharacterized protein n=1 Tax=Naganishia cerealis TaxID=610337 RepID=A0ACC2VPQ5_9TREE|nr:hypothetical protein QFC19_005495 [Naganishia cerealis]
MDRPLPDIGLTAISEPPENFYLDYVGITYPSAPVTGPGITGETTSVVDRDDPAYWRRRVREERKELEDDNERALSDLSRVRAWKDKLLSENRELIRDTARLKAEVSSLTASLNSVQAEVRRLKERYEGTRRVEVALEEELSASKAYTLANLRLTPSIRVQSPASLPLELLSNVAGFIAGGNNYGTLINFSLMSNRMWQETLPTLFETVVWNRDLQVKLINTLTMASL